MSRNGKVIVAMSGGVDSSVAACLLKEQGYDCVGVFMRVGVEHEDVDNSCRLTGAEQNHAKTADAESDTGKGLPVLTFPPSHVPTKNHRHGCCSATDALDARAIAGRLGIPFYSLNFRKDFDRIIDYFVDEYGRARTPNPCVMCNIHLKFGKLLRYADMMEAEFVATGHYARILRPGGPASAQAPAADSVRLARSLNRAKDQSYVLFGIRREDLPRCLFPIGEIPDKAEVRRIAAELGLRVHDKPDSQEICFVPDQDYARLVHEKRPDTHKSGEIRDSAGKVLGQHEGIASYTIGQRRGLGLAVGHPIYVTHLDAATNTMVVGPREELLRGGLIADRMNWLMDPPLVNTTVPAQIKIRHMHAPTPGHVRRLSDDSVEVVFDTPQPAVTPGQAAVFYDGEIALGGGWIREALENCE